MRGMVVYESMYGNTHLIAEAVAKGMAPLGDVDVVPVAQADPASLQDAELVVVGGPTHVHGMSRESTRKAALEAAEDPAKDLHVDPDAAGIGLRDWFESVGTVHTAAAAFDTRNQAPAAFTGRASKGVAKLLRHHGCTLVTPPESFLVDKANHLLPGEQDRAEAWGRHLAAMLAASDAAGQSRQ